MPALYALATMDTKGEEIAFIAECARRAGVEVKTVDVGTHGQSTVPPDVDHQTVAAFHPDGKEAVLGQTDRGTAVSAMSEALTLYLLAEYAKGAIGGVIGIGGSGGTSLISRGLRALPIGLPKLLVSTVASGNTQPYVDCSDICMLYSVVDVAGLNAVSRKVFANAAHAMAGMMRETAPMVGEPKPTLGMTMFGVTTPCVTAVREALEARGYDCLVFHATGTGGRAMEKLVESGLIEGVLDITTTEVADEVVGGVFAAGPARFDAILRAGVPYILSLGALDMVNFGSLDTVPEAFRERNLYKHNDQVTLMRTTPEENVAFAQWIAGKLKHASSPVTILIPEGGVSLLDAPGQPFHDPEADRMSFETLEQAVATLDHVQVKRLPTNINDPAFADALVTAYLNLHAAPTS